MVVAKFDFYKPRLLIAFGALFCKDTAATTGLSAKSLGIVAAVCNRGMKNNAVPTSYDYGILAFSFS